VSSARVWMFMGVVVEGMHPSDNFTSRETSTHFL
jgi:hypothetical protein